MPVLISRTSVTTVEVTLIPETGEFRVTNRGRLAAKGVISVPKGPCLDRDIFPACFVSQVKPEDVTYNLTSEDIYAELRSRGYNYGPGFELLLKADNTDTMTKTTWTGSWLCLMEAMLQTFILSLPGQQQLQRIRSIKIDPKKMPKVQGSQSSEICCRYDRPVDMVVTDGVEMRGVGVMPIATGSAVSTIASVIFSNGFYPFLENVPEIIPSFLQKYAEDCIKFCMQEFTKLMAMNTTDTTAAQRDVIREILLEHKIKPAPEEASLQDYQNSNICSLAQMLVKLFALAGSGTMSGEVPQLVDQMSDALIQDCLLSSLCFPEILAPCLEIVTDNVRGSELNILEIDAHDNKFYKHVLPLLQSTGNKSAQYNVIVSKDANMMDESKMIRVLNTDPRTDSLEHLNKQNLIVLANYLNKHSDVDAILAKISALIDDRNGYLLVTETTDNQVLYYMKSLFTSQPENVKNGRIYGRFFNVPMLEELFTRHGLQVVYRKSDSLLSTLFLLKRRQISQPTPKVVIVNSEERLFGQMIKSEIDKVILSARKDENLWIMTASKTSTEVSDMLTWLRTKKESDLEKVRFAVVTCLKTTAALENIRKSPCFTRIMEMDQIFNVYRDGVWGVMSSFSKTLDPMSRQQPCMYAQVTSSRPGDLSSLTWVESPLKYQTSEHGFANVHYSSLNFKDIMIASGKIPSDLIDGETGIGEARVGIEWSGVDSTGRRLAGMVLNKGYATAVMVNPSTTFSIPDHWSMEEAATIPIAYITAYHGLITVGNIQPGESVLIHCGAGALGQACIRIAISKKCEVFTTVGSQEKREFLKKMFPSLTDRHFANSRNLSFEFDILNATKGRGVNVVVNSLAGRSLRAGLRVLAQNGRFVEVGKRDIVLNTPIGMSFMRNGAGIQAYFIDCVPYHSPSLWERTRKLTQEGIDNGVVQPLKCHVFTSDQTTDAFRLMESGKHTGKIVIKIRDEAKKAGPPSPVRVMAITKTYCHPQKCYIVVGDLGGFGRNLADWLVQRGANKLVLCGSGHEQGYWRRRHQTWTSKGASVCFCDGNLDMAQLLNTVSKLGSVGAIFDVNRFQPKTTTEFSISPDKMTEALEMATKDFPGADVDHFVVLASAGSGGDSGSTDSSLSTAGTVCERRRANGKHGLLLQFDMTKEGVTKVGHQCTGQPRAEPRLEPKTVALCMETLDHLLCQKPPCAVIKCSLS